MTNPDTYPNIQRTEAPPQQSGDAQKIDIQALAEKVYRLMLADVRLEQARDTRSSHKRR